MKGSVAGWNQDVSENGSSKEKKVDLSGYNYGLWSQIVLGLSHGSVTS